MSKYDFILDNITWSYSSVSSFGICPAMFKLSYIEAVKRGGNFFSDFGSFSHKILEEYFRNKLDIMELSQYYEKNYTNNIISFAPPYPKGMSEKYYDQGLHFFDNFDFDKNKYDIIDIENKIETVHNDIKLVLKPDLILKDKSNNKTLLIDYKTSSPFKGDKPDMKKIEEYKKQLYLYSYFINNTSETKIDIIKLWFLRLNKWYEFDYNENDASDVVNWFYYTILDIKSEEEFAPCDTKKNAYFCENICSTKEYCPYWP